jgi:ubiquinone/menaquinone biosynthesis C-methylase UbiE
MKMSNAWNRLVYRLWAPVYDAALGRFFLPGRTRALALLDLQPGERVLLVGCGTGADLPLLPYGAEAVGVDLSPHMLARARSRLPLPDRSVTLLQADAQVLAVEEGVFQAAVFNLVLSVVPDGGACLRQNLRALAPGGRAVVFDKFAPEVGGVSLARRAFNALSTWFGTDVTRRFHDLLEGSGAEVVREEASLLGGAYRIYLLVSGSRNG